MEWPSRRPAARIWRGVCVASIIVDRRPLLQIQITRAFGGPDSSTRRSVATRARTRAMTSFAEGQPREDVAHGARPDDSAELYRLLVATVRDYAIFALDASGHVLTWNAGAKHLKGYEASEIIGRHFSVFYPPEDVVAGKPRVELIGAARDGRFEDEG